MRSLSQPLRMRSSQPQTLVLIDARHTIYSHKGTIDPLVTKFVEMLQLTTKHFFFLFCHKRRNAERANTLNERLLQQKFILHKQLVQTTNVLDTIIALIDDFCQQINANIGLKRRSLAVVGEKQEKHRLVIVTHNPISLRFAKLVQHMTEQRLLRLFDVHFFYHSSYHQDPRKKCIIERHFYQYNFGSKHQGFTFYHIANLVQMLPHLQETFPVDRLVIGYYFYHKKSQELLISGVLLDSAKVKLVPVDLRYYNDKQFPFIKVLFQKIFDLNKTNEIKFTASEVETFKLHYARLLEQYTFKNIDPVDMIPVIASRTEFQDVFDAIIESAEGRQIMEHHAHAIRTPKYRLLCAMENGFHQYTKYPAIVKTSAAAFTPNCHTMAIVVSDAGLDQIRAEPDFQCDLIVQELVNHDGVIYKVYCIGSTVLVQKRKSIPNIEATNFKFDSGCYIFDSQKDIFKLVSECLVHSSEPVLDGNPKDGVFQDIIRELSLLIRNHFKIALFGFDIIIDNRTQDLNLIDINHFPGYKNVQNIKELFELLFMET